MDSEFVIARLKTNLLTTGLQNKDQALFQVINQLIDFIQVNSQSISALAADDTGGGGGSGTVTTVNDDTIYTKNTPDPIITSGTTSLEDLSKAAIDMGNHVFAGGI